MLGKVLLVLIAAITAGWIIYEFKRAPLMDDDGNIIEENKKD
jgi:hypothetical protein